MLRLNQEERTTTRSPSRKKGSHGKRLNESLRHDQDARRRRRAVWERRARFVWTAKSAVAAFFHLFSIGAGFMLIVCGFGFWVSLDAQQTGALTLLAAPTLCSLFLSLAANHFFKFDGLVDRMLEAYLKRLARNGHVDEEAVRRPLAIPD